MKYAKRNKAFLRNTIRSLRKELIERFLFPFVSKWFSLVFDDACSGIYVSPEDRKDLIDFFSFAFLSSLVRWIGSGMPDDEASLLQRVTAIRDMVRLYDLHQAAPEAEAEPFSILQKLSVEQSCF